MLRQPIFALGIGALAVVFALVLPPQGLKAADSPHAAAPEGQAEAKGAAGHEAGTEGKTNPMEVQPSLALWTFVVFLGLVFVLGRYAWKPLLQALHQREEHVEHCLLQTEKARNESEQLLAEHRRLMAQTDEQVRSILEKAARNAQANAEEILKQAQAEAEASRERAQREIATARDQALAEIWHRTADLSVAVAGRVLSRQLSDDDHRRLLDMAIQELPSAASSTASLGGSRA